MPTPTNEERIGRAEKLLEQMSQRLDSPGSADSTDSPDDSTESEDDPVKKLLDQIKHDADNQHQMIVDMGEGHTRHAEEVVASIAALKTLQVDEVKLVELALGNFP